MKFMFTLLLLILSSDVISSSDSFNVITEDLYPEGVYREPIHLRGQFYYGDRVELSRPDMSMILYRDDGVLEGYYFYDGAYKKWKSKFKLKGVIEGDNIYLEAFNEKGVKEETFSGKFKGFNGQATIDAKWERGTDRSGKVAFATRELFDHNLTCDEMRYAGEIAFLSAAGDLGSGHGSSKKVDYNCKDSLYTAPEFQRIYTIAADIRGGKKKTSCDGSVWYAKSRYSKNNLLRASFSPKTYNNEKKWKPISKAYSYLQDWSKKGIYNHELYEKFLSEIKVVEPILQNYYKNNFTIDNETAKKYAKGAIDSFVTFAGGSYYYNWEPSNYNNSLTTAIIESRPLPEIKELLEGSSAIKLAIHQAANNLEVTEYLIERGFEVDSENYFGKTALYYAIQFNNMDVIKALIVNGANVNHQYKSKEELYGDEKWACRYIERTLRTPLMHAAQHSTPQIIKFLLQSGADLNMQDENSSTALDYAKKDENIIVLK